MEMGNRRYASDKPKDCRYCYWWGGKKKGCIRKDCFYLLPEKPKKQNIPGECEFCPYGKHFPCIGYCTVKLLMEMKEKD